MRYNLTCRRVRRIKQVPCRDLKLVVVGTASWIPCAGIAWMDIEIVLGLLRLGHDVHYFELPQIGPTIPTERVSSRTLITHRNTLTDWRRNLASRIAGRIAEVTATKRGSGSPASAPNRYCRLLMQS